VNNLTELIYHLEDLKLYRQSRVNRWQLRDYMFTQNDAEHQLFVSQIVVYLADLLCIDDKVAFAALKYACVHDYVESVETSLGDVNYMIKEKNPELKSLVKRLERDAMRTVPAFYRAMVNCEEIEDAMTLVKLADALDALLYTRREIRHNKNDDEWNQIEKEASERAEELLRKLCEG
jgi:hypothetical protein